MPKLYYALIARQRVILCDYALVQGSYEAAIQTALDRAITDGQTSISYEDGSLVYHLLMSGGLIYLCVADIVFDRPLAFSCLKELESSLYNSPGLREKAAEAGPYALRKEFATEMSLVLSRYATGDKLGKLQTQVTSVTGVMRGNLEKVMERGETLDDLEDRSQKLAHSSTDFRQSAVRLRRKEQYRNIKLWCIVGSVCGVILVLVILGIVLGALGGSGKL